MILLWNVQKLNFKNFQFSVMEKEESLKFFNIINEQVNETDVSR